MTVAELKAILDTLPDDTEVLVNYKRRQWHSPKLFLSDRPVLAIVPCATPALVDAQERPHWRHLSKPALE